MKTLYERLLDDEDNLLSGMDEDLVKDQLEDIYDISLIEKIELKDDGIYITGSLVCNDNKAKSLIIPGINIKYVSGDFKCAMRTRIKSLKGAPRYVGGNFDCSSCPELKNLKGSPEEVEGFKCYECNKLKNLEGISSKIYYINCSNCENLGSLKGAPEDVTTVECFGCPKLKSYGKITRTRTKIIRKFEDRWS